MSLNATILGTQWVLNIGVDMKLTKSIIQSMVYEKEGNKADLRYDSNLRGFGVRVFPSGVKSFFIDYRNANGTKRRHTIGKFGPLTLKQASDNARQMLGDVTKGYDPSTDRKQRRNQISFKEFAATYLDHVQHRKKSIKDDRQRLRDHIVPKLGSKKLSEITLQQIQKLVEGVKDKLSPATANRCGALIKHMFTIAVEWEHLEKSPAKMLKMFKEPPPRDIVLSPDDMVRLIKACKEDQNIHLSRLFLLAMFTGRRIGEIQKAKWSDINLERRIWTVPDTKAGEQQYIVITDAVLDLLDNIPKIEGNPHLIIGNKPNSHVVNYRRAWDRIIVRAGIKPFPPHGLRHNFASTLVATGIGLPQIQKLLGHKSPLTTNKYAHHRPDDLQRAAGQFSNVVSGNGK